MTNDDLAKIVETNDEWIRSRTVSVENMHRREVKIDPGSPYKVVWNKEAARPKLQK